MLGRELNDPLHTELEIPRIEGLGLLDISTTFAPEKVTTQVEAQVDGGGPLLKGAMGSLVTGYEIHMGRTELVSGASPAFTILMRSGEKVHYTDGAVSQDGMTFGTYIHGIFDNDDFRRTIINRLRRMKGYEPLEAALATPSVEQRHKDFEKLASVVRGSLDMDKIYSVLGLDGPKEGL